MRLRREPIELAMPKRSLLSHLRRHSALVRVSGEKRTETSEPSNSCRYAGSSVASLATTRTD